jgi:hypothetical protein
MTLTTIEQKVFADIKIQISNLATRGAINEYDTFYEEDIEERIMDIDTLIVLLNEEKAMLGHLLAAKI